MRILLNILVAVLGLMFSWKVWADQPPSDTQTWRQWVSELRVEALSEGVSSQLFDHLFDSMKQPNHKVLFYNKTQPERRLTYLQYRKTRVDAYRIQIGRREFEKNKSLLDAVGHDYGVDPCFIVSLWGMETSYGRFMGSFPVIQSLASLSYDSDRSRFFRKQLLVALHILDEGHIDEAHFKGEWAGASGQPQFLPTSWSEYAVDRDQDGRRDIWTSHPDVFASIANYLAKNGWQSGEPWAIQVSLPNSSEVDDLVNSKQKRSVAEWRALGLKTIDGRPWPENSLTATLIYPDGGPAFLTFDNFNVLMKWNHSTYYVGSVGYLAEQVCGRPLQ